MSDEVQVKIGKDLIAPIVEARIQAAILSALSNPEEIANEMMKRVLLQKVNENGNISQYDRDNRYTLVDVICRNAVRDAAKAAFLEWLEENRPLLKEALKKQIASSPSKFAKIFIDGLAGTLKSDWRINVNVTTND